MKQRDQLICLWLLPVCGVLFLLTFLLNPAFRSPIAPTETAEQVAAFYRGATGSVRAAMLVYNFCGALLIPFYMVVVNQMKRVAVTDNALAYAYLSAVASSAALYAVADLFWLAAAFRPERAPELTLFLNDLAWISFLLPAGLVLLQSLALALCIYGDPRPRPIFPRWVGHFNLAAGLMLAPSVLGMTMLHGAFAWSGLYSYWLRMIGFAIYMAVMFVVMMRIVAAQDSDEGVVT